MSTNKYAASRALAELDAKRQTEDWAGDTALLPKLDAPPMADDETVPMLPALIRPQA